ncbi:MAG: TspO/MBR family protein [bacterium]
MTNQRNKSWLAGLLVLLGFVIVSQLAGAVGSLFTAPSIPTWYAGLVKPALNPPGWIFGPVWTLLYALMGAAAFLVWRRGWSRAETRIALAVFGLQLVLNALWSIVFFGWQQPGWALMEIALLWLSILATILLFRRVSRAAAWLLVPYLLWVSFASYLNYSIWTLN